MLEIDNTTYEYRTTDPGYDVGTWRMWSEGQQEWCIPTEGGDGLYRRLKNRPKTVEDVIALVTDSECLDDLVRDMIDKRAAEVNNEGVRGQVAFLSRQGMDCSDIIDWLEAEARDAAADIRSRAAAAFDDVHYSTDRGKKTACGVDGKYTILPGGVTCRECKRKMPPEAEGETVY